MLTHLNSLKGVLARNLLRYAGGLLVMFGILDSDGLAQFIGHPDSMQAAEIIVGMAFAVIAEVWWMLARRFGWER
jgi:hypothetical protein